MEPAIIVHGGAGSWRIDRRRIDEGVKAIHKALLIGWDVLKSDGSSVEGVVEALKYMEDSGFFNAGRGSCLNFLGYREMDAGIMDGYSERIGAVAGVRYPRNPIELAKFVMEETDHLIISGEGADTLAKKIGLEKISDPPEYIIERYRELRKNIDRSLRERYNRNIKIFEMFDIGDTIGAVALDKEGHIASGVSTGGIWLKLPGRIGDTPIPGAGFYATKEFGIASTGYGEIIIRVMPGLKIDLMMKNGVSLRKSINRVFNEMHSHGIKNNVGIIGIDNRGDIVYSFDTEAMMVAYKSKSLERAFLARSVG